MKTILLASVLLSAITPLIATTSDQNTAPSDYVPVQIVQKVRPIYPVRLLYEGVLRGEATVVMEIGVQGNVMDKLVTSYTHEDFASEAMRTIERWAFRPALLEGRPIVSVLSLTFQFEMDGVVAFEKRFEGMRDEEYHRGRYPYFPRGIDTLDRKPAGTHLTSPIYPKEWIDEGRGGSVVLRYYIDESGTPRVPIVVHETDPLLAGAAVAAVKEWRFETPRSRGKPVLAQVEQEFVFKNPRGLTPKM